ncbi:MAG: KEOPS complex subunit Pcc1 [Candidatus Bathyarchaeia archaeon]|jgi:tRNA threonylcarbamoyladenosine modification (KEOPS) complex  Pcc1 subunit
MAINAKATIRLKLPSDKQLTTLLNALTPEANAPVTRRATVKLEKDGLFLMLAVDAEDTVALRSTLNAYLRWINSAINVIDVVERA